MKKDYFVLLNQVDRNLASDVSTRCSGHPQGMKTSVRKDVAVNDLAGNYVMLHAVTYDGPTSQFSV